MGKGDGGEACIGYIVQYRVKWYRYGYVGMEGLQERTVYCGNSRAERECSRLSTTPPSRLTFT